ncbi:MAG: hypothetical protein Q7J78_07140 [Clostridiales bacterium]|nr:hypothetical protein [Clostridiales bacterium]
MPQRRMKVKKGGSIGKSILFLFLGIIIAAVGFGIFWFTGLTSIKPDFAMPTNPDSPSVVQAFENFIANAKSGPVKAAFNEDESSYVTSKLFDETTFFNFQDFGGQGIKRLTMTPSEENVRLKMLVELANFSLFKTSSGIKAFYAAPAAGGTVQATLIGIDALLDIRSNGNQLEVKPLKVNIGSSPIPVDTAISMLRQYAPGVMISDDGYISVGPMTIYDRNTGEKLFDISSIKAEEGLLVIETK